MIKKPFLSMMFVYLFASLATVLCMQNEEELMRAEAEKQAQKMLMETSSIKEVSEWLRGQYNKLDPLNRPAGTLEETMKNLRIDQIQLLGLLNLSVQRDCKLNLAGDDQELVNYRKIYNGLPQLLKVVIGDYIVTTGPGMKKLDQPEPSPETPAVPEAKVKETKLSDGAVRIEVSQPAIPIVIESSKEDQKIIGSGADTPPPAGQPVKQPVAPVVTPEPVEKIAAPVKPIRTSVSPVHPIKKQPPKVGSAGMMLPAPQLKQPATVKKTDFITPTPMDRSKLSRMEIRRQRRARRRGMKPLPIVTPIAPASAKPVVPIEAAKVVETVEMVVTEPAAPGVKAAEEPFKVPE